jgi:hypothetical protein
MDLLKKVYEEACYGYLDLKESVCDRNVGEFLDGREIVQPTTMLAEGIRTGATDSRYSGFGGGGVTITSTSLGTNSYFPTTNAWVDPSTTDQIHANAISRMNTGEGITMTSSGHIIQLTDEIQPPRTEPDLGQVNSDGIGVF